MRRLASKRIAIAELLYNQITDLITKEIYTLDILQVNTNLSLLLYAK